MNNVIASVLAGEASDLEHQQLQRWLRESPENEKLFQDMERVWRLSEPHHSGTLTHAPSIVEIVAEAEARRAGVVPASEVSAKHSVRWFWAVALAAVFVISLVGFL